MVETVGFRPLWRDLHSGQVQSVTNVGFAAACRPHIRCNGGGVAIDSFFVNTRRRPHAGLKRLQRRAAISCTGGARRTASGRPRPALPEVELGILAAHRDKR